MKTTIDRSFMIKTWPYWLAVIVSPLYMAAITWAPKNIMWGFAIGSTYALCCLPMIRHMRKKERAKRLEVRQSQIEAFNAYIDLRVQLNLLEALAQERGVETVEPIIKEIRKKFNEAEHNILDVIK